MKNSEQSFNIFLMLILVICTGCPVHLVNALCLPLNELKKMYHICKFPAYRGCSIEIKGVFVRDHELDLHNVHESPKIEHLMIIWQSVHLWRDIVNPYFLSDWNIQTVTSSIVQD